MTKQDTPERRGKHTPGPWGAGGTMVWGGAKGSCRNTICDCTCAGSITRDEDEANARLIAAAPDLLCWLEAIISQGEAQRKAGDNVITIGGGMAHGIMESIRKAKGE
jgi:hypothetical protein